MKVKSNTDIKLLNFIVTLRGKYVPKNYFPTAKLTKPHLKTWAT